jgi:hypothetical protein
MNIQVGSRSIPIAMEPIKIPASTIRWCSTCATRWQIDNPLSPNEVPNA